MTRRRVTLAAAGFCAATTIGTAAHADDAVDEPVRVVIAGPKKDPIAARLAKEVVALGFTPVMVGALENCARAAVTAAVAAAEAGAALCSDGDQVGVWTPKTEGQPALLRDVVAPQERGPHGREEVATRAAEIMRASVALQEPEPEPEPAPAPAPASAPFVLGSWDDLDSADRPPPSPLPKRAARFSASAGGSLLASGDAAATGFSFHGTLGVHRSFSLTAHVDGPIGGAFVPLGAASTVFPRNSDTSELRVYPGIAGLGFELPLAAPDARFIPRVGATLGVAWLHAARTAGTAIADNGVPFTTEPASATVAAPAGWASASLSIHVYGPIRGVFEGLVGTAAGRLTVRDLGVPRAHWGTPLGGLALRAEVLLP